MLKLVQKIIAAPINLLLRIERAYLRTQNRRLEKKLDRRKKSSR